jgi:hypothetical protein
MIYAFDRTNQRIAALVPELGETIDMEVLIVRARALGDDELADKLTKEYVRRSMFETATPVPTTLPGETHGEVAATHFAQKDADPRSGQHWSAQLDTMQYGRR